jgi:hypothetical protein
MKMRRPAVIRKWPGMAETEVDKVPTMVEYRAGKKGILAWGFECSDPAVREPEKRVIDRFKLYLDNEFLNNSPENVGTSDDVRMWFEDFLRALHHYTVKYICGRLELDVSCWELREVHYVLSVPTVWDTAVALKLKDIAKSAGIGDAETHFVEVKLTEAEAAAVYAASSPRASRPVNDSEDDLDSSQMRGTLAECPRFCKDDVLLVCDSGGGTTVLSQLSPPISYIRG